MDDNDFERVRASDLRDYDVVQSRSAGGGCDLDDGQTDGECSAPGDGAEPGAELPQVPSGAVAGGLVGVGSECRAVAFVVEDI